jgi:hypothetical protein
MFAISSNGNNKRNKVANTLVFMTIVLTLIHALANVVRDFIGYLVHK